MTQKLRFIFQLKANNKLLDVFSLMSKTSRNDYFGMLTDK
jgi:hypothetical protein